MQNYLNLRLFGTQTTTSASDGNNLTAEMKTFYDRTLIDMAEPELVHDQFGQRRPIPAGDGKVISFRRFSPLAKATSALTEGVTPSGNNLNVTATNTTVYQYGDFILQSDLLELAAIDNTVVESTAALAAQAGRTLDTIVRNELVGGTQVIYAPKVSGSTETEVEHRYSIDATALLTPKLVARAVTQLKSMNAPKIDGSYVAVIHPHVAYDLMRSTEWIDAHKYAAPENLFNGEIGKVAGCRFVETTEAKIWRGANLHGDSATLTIAGYTAATKVATIDEALTSAEATALVGREVIIDGVHNIITAAAAGNAGSATITLKTNPTSNAPADGDIVYPGEGGAEGTAVYGCLFLGANAYGVSEITGGGLELIVKQKGYGDDPLNQRSSVGWKATKACTRLVEEYIVRVECGSSYSGSASAN